MQLKRIIRLGKLQKKKKEQNKIYIPPQTGNVSWHHIFMITQSVMPKIYMPVFLSAAWAVLLKVIYNVCDTKSEVIKTIFFPSSLVTYLGLVLSLLLVFRNNSAYDRFWEGRKAWAGILTNVRNLSRNIWIGVEINENNTDKKNLDQLNSKKGVMRLLVALTVSVKHTLKGEYGWDYDDIVELVQHVPRFNSLMSTAPKEVLKLLPLEIAYHIQGYLFLQKNIPPTLITPIYNSINAIIDNLTSCERILLTPIPIIYGIHIKHTLIFYILTLPLQVIPTCGWMTILIVVLTSFTLFGIEAISSEIENPFGSDKNDLKLDEFCQQIHDEIFSMMKYFPSSISVVDWLDCDDSDSDDDTCTLDIDDKTAEDELEKANEVFHQLNKDKTFCSTITTCSVNRSNSLGSSRSRSSSRSRRNRSRSRNRNRNRSRSNNSNVRSQEINSSQSTAETFIKQYCKRSNSRSNSYRNIENYTNINYDDGKKEYSAITINNTTTNIKNKNNLTTDNSRCHNNSDTVGFGTE